MKGGKEGNCRKIMKDCKGRTDDEGREGRKEKKVIK